MKRGDLVIVAQKGHYEGKPRPAVVIQIDALVEAHPSVLVCQLSGDPRSDIGAFFRIPITPTPANGLDRPSVIMADRVVTIERGNVRDVIGQLDHATLGRLNVALALFQGLTPAS